MDDRTLERLLHDEFAAMSRPSPDPAFVGQVMKQIESNEVVAIDARRPLIVGAAFCLGLVFLVLSLTSLDLWFIGSFQDVVSGMVEQVFSSPVAGWYWIVLLLPLCWMTLVES